MNQVVAWVEGPSDRAAMETLLEPLLRERREAGIAIRFFDAPAGDRKKSLLLKVPDKAVNLLANNREARAAVIPDLYPKNRGFPHETFGELEEGILDRVRRAVIRKKLEGRRIEERFRVFCFKHDLEALLLASPEALAGRLGVPQLQPTWMTPVEDQDHKKPPKRIVEELFVQHGQRYRDTVDAPLILAAAHYLTVAERCPQCFRPFVEFLDTLES